MANQCKWHQHPRNEHSCGLIPRCGSSLGGQTLYHHTEGRPGEYGQIQNQRTLEILLWHLHHQKYVGVLYRQSKLLIYTYIHETVCVEQSRQTVDGWVPVCPVVLRLD